MDRDNPAVIAGGNLLAGPGDDKLSLGPLPIDEVSKPREVARETLEHPPLFLCLGGRFRYDPAGPWVLDGIDLHLAPGRHVALVGASGSGKSTIARVLTRFCDLDEGRATLNDHDLREYAQDDVRRQITSLRDQLVAEHLGVAVDKVAGHRSLLAAIEDLRGDGKTLEPFTEDTIADEASPLAENDLMDPDHVPRSLTRTVQRFVAGLRR